VNYKEYEKTKRGRPSMQTEHHELGEIEHTDLTLAPSLRGFERNRGYQGVLHYLQSLGLSLAREVNKILTLRNENGYLCPIHNRVHEQDNPYVYVCRGSYIFNCRRVTDEEKQHGKDKFIIGIENGEDSNNLEDELKRILPLYFYSGSNFFKSPSNPGFTMDRPAPA
jgi:hypothetical protein